MRKKFISLVEKLLGDSYAQMRLGQLIADLVLLARYPFVGYVREIFITFLLCFHGLLEEREVQLVSASAPLAVHDLDDQLAVAAHQEPVSD
jgi:hypothetical protein